VGQFGGIPAVRGEEIGHYLLSLPERVVRSASALAGGLLRELGDVTIPKAARNSRIYRTMVEATLRFLIEQVGEVEGTYPEQGRLAQDFALRRAAGNGIEFAGMLAFRAALADLSGAGRRVVREIAESLKEEKLLDPDATFETVDQILDGLEKCAGRLAEAINTPPLDVAGLRKEWTEIRQEAASIPAPNLPSAESVRCHWEDLRREAAAQDRSVYQLSSLLALSTISRLPENAAKLSRSALSAARRTGGLFADPLLEHYQDTLREIREAGYLAYWSREFRPYLKAAAEQFSPERKPLTQRLLRRRETGQ
jgi:hypothetical protein